MQKIPVKENTDYNQKKLKIFSGQDDISVTERKNSPEGDNPMSTTSSVSSSLSLTALGTGIDWQSMLTELTQVADKSLTPLTNEKTTYNAQLSAWQSFGSTLSSLQTAAANLDSASDFALTTASVSSSSSTSASSLLTATTDSTATPGTYQIVINNAAQAEQLASNSFSSESSALGISGTILVNGQAVQLQATDSLQDLSSKINMLNSGTSASNVTASIMQDSSSTYRLVLTSDTQGAAGISLLDGGTSDTLGALGFNGTGTVVKNTVAGGAQSDSFSSASTSVEALLGIDGQDLSGTVTINGKQVALDLTDSLNTIASTLTSAGVSTTVVPQTSGSTTTYKLQVEGMSSWTDSNNVLQALGLIEGNRANEVGVTGSVANTTDGSTPITAATKITDIYGYNTNSSGDKITISGTQNDGTAATSTSLAITSSTTVQDLLTQIDNTFQNVTASVTSDGQIQVLDNATGTSQLSVNLQTTVTDPNGGVLDFGSFGQAGAVKKYVLQQGENASFSVDGMNMTSTTNTVTGAIPGVTLNLQGQDPNTTLTLNVATDTQGIESAVNSFITAYNNTMSFINTQNTYTPNASTNGDGSTSGSTGGPLFGDNTLQNVKQQLQTTVLSKVGTSQYDYLADIGITIGDNGTLSLNSSTFTQALSTNFNDVVNLFTSWGSSSSPDFTFSGNDSSTQSGTYAVNITQLSGNGQNIAGTIDGQQATGSGNFLTLDNASSLANGLSIQYSGTTVPASTNFTFSNGIASLISNLTNQLTDPVSGTITLQENGIQTSINSLTKKMTDMQNNINQQMSNMQTEFENMNSTVAQLDQTQSYLTTQLASL
jgi:flagellar hook-associated protein 2